MEEQMCTGDVVIRFNHEHTLDTYTMCLSQLLVHILRNDLEWDAKERIVRISHMTQSRARELCEMIRECGMGDILQDGIG